jgi:hypothetical protein
MNYSKILKRKGSSCRMLDRCDICGAYLEDGGLLCERCREDMNRRIKHRNERNENRVKELEIAYESVRN